MLAPLILRPRPAAMALERDDISTSEDTLRTRWAM